MRAAASVAIVAYTGARLLSPVWVMAVLLVEPPEEAACIVTVSEVLRPVALSKVMVVLPSFKAVKVAGLLKVALKYSLSQVHPSGPLRVSLSSGYRVKVSPTRTVVGRPLTASGVVLEEPDEPSGREDEPSEPPLDELPPLDEPPSLDELPLSLLLELSLSNLAVMVTASPGMVKV